MTQIALNLPSHLAAYQSIFTAENGRLYTTSREIAKRFGKRHADVLRGINNLLADLPDPEFNERNFALVNYLDEKGEARPEYRLTHDGFAIVTMGFTGSEALAWKIAFLKAFDTLRAENLLLKTRYATALRLLHPMLVPVVEGTEQGLSRGEIAGPLGKSVNSITYHRRKARELGLLH